MKEKATEKLKARNISQGDLGFVQNLSRNRRLENPVSRIRDVVRSEKIWICNAFLMTF